MALGFEDVGKHYRKQQYDKVNSDEVRLEVL